MSDSSSATGSTQSGSGSSQRSNNKTKFERDIEAARRRGVSECTNLLHWEVKRITDPTGGTSWTDAGIKSPRDILTLMSPGKARCSCEKRACQWAWSNPWNHKGMYQTQYVPAGVEQKGVGEVTPGFPAKKVFPLNFNLSSEQFRSLSDRFSDWYFVCETSGCHDHPIAHTSTKIASRRVMDSLARGTKDRPKVYVDLHGNPSANEAYMRRVAGVKLLTFVELITPKDYVRAATKWGPQYDDDGEPRYYTTHVRDIPRDHQAMGLEVDGIISIHTTYYYDANEVSNLLAWAPRAKMLSAMHKFDGITGSINCGEQNWVKQLRGSQTLITQTNVLSGEAYKHPDNSWWYSHDSWTDGSNGFAWTINMLCDDTFLITSTYCPAIACRMSEKCVQVAPLMPVVKHSTATAMSQEEIAVSGVVSLKLYGAKSQMPIAPEHVDFFGEMRFACMSKARTAKQFQDHVSRVKIAAKKFGEKNKLLCDAQRMHDIALFSFFIDFEDQYGQDSGMFGSNYAKTLMADPMYRNGAASLTTGTLSMLTDILMSAADAKNVKTGVMKGARAMVQHANRANVLKTL